MLRANGAKGVRACGAHARGVPRVDDRGATTRAEVRVDVHVRARPTLLELGRHDLVRLVALQDTTPLLLGHVDHPLLGLGVRLPLAEVLSDEELLPPVE